MNKVDCSSVLKDGKLEAVDDLREQQQALYLLAIWYADCTKAWQKVSQAWSISEWWRHIWNAFCVKQWTRSNRPLNDIMMFMKLIFFYTFGLNQEARKVKKVTFTVHNNGITSEVMVIFKISWCSIFAQNCANWYEYFKDIGIWMQWSHLILQVKNWIVDVIARWRHWCYKFVQYRYVRNITMLKCTKNHANRLRRFKDIDSQTSWPTFLAHPVVCW